MKIFSKTWFKNNKAIFLLVLVAAFLRFYNFEGRVLFWTEQAKSLITSSDYLVKPSLLGQEYFREDSFGHKIFSGAYFNYSLIPLIFVFKGEPLHITAYFALLNIFTGLIVFLLVKRIHGDLVAHISAFLFLFNDYMIYHSLFIWNYNHLPLVGIVLYYLALKNLKKVTSKTVLVTGLVSGLGVSLQILFIPIALIVMFLSLLKSGRKLFHFVLFSGGMLLGNLPMVLFDLRHSFYQTKTILRFLMDTIEGTSSANMAYYYFLPFWPVFIIVTALILVKISKKIPALTILILLIYFYTNLTSNLVDFKNPVGTPGGLKLAELKNASGFIAVNAGESFNVASTLDFDKRAYPLRYLLRIGGRVPMPEDSYEKVQDLFVIAEKEYNFSDSGIWEINAGGPYKVTRMENLNARTSLFRLTK
jgi:hypothetical protein